MNAQPKTAALIDTIPAHPPASVTAHRLVYAAKSLLPYFETGKPIDAKMLRTAMEVAFGASDTSGAWVWKDAYDAVEIAQIMMITRYGALMQKQAVSSAQFLSMIERLSALAPSHTRRSEDSVRLQQFSTPLPLAAIVAEAAGFRPSDLVLEPSAGTGMLAVFGQIAGADIALNELAEVRRGILRALFGGAPVSGHDAASIDDRLDRAITPSVIVMNPPFSAAQHVDGKFRKATSQHVLSALARLAPAGRLVVITGESFAPKTKSHQSTFRSIGEVANVVFSAAIAGKIFARHGTSIDTRLTVIDKRSAGDDVTKTGAEDVYHPLCESTGDLLAAVLAHCPERPDEMPPAPPMRVRSPQNPPRSLIYMHCAMPHAKKAATSLRSAPSTPSTALMPARLYMNQRSGQTLKALCKTRSMRIMRYKPSRSKALPPTPPHWCSQPLWRLSCRRCQPINRSFQLR